MLGFHPFATQSFSESTPFVDALIQAQNKFEKEIAKLINPDQVDKTFFETDSTQEGSGQASEALSSENKGA